MSMEGEKAQVYVDSETLCTYPVNLWGIRVIHFTNVRHFYILKSQGKGGWGPLASSLLGC